MRAWGASWGLKINKSALATQVGVAGSQKQWLIGLFRHSQILSIAAVSVVKVGIETFSLTGQ